MKPDVPFAATPVSLPFFREEDAALSGMLPSVRLLADGIEEISPAAAETYDVSAPDGDYAFLHEAAVTAFRGTLFASWYNCPEKELSGRTPIRGKRSRDGGRSWSGPETIADDPAGKILFCPPVYGADRGKLYLFLNEMTAPDHIHALSLFTLSPETDVFQRLWTRPVPFKLNANVTELPGGRLLLAGRAGELDGFPNTPAVMLSDGGIEGEWRLVRIAKNGDLPDGSALVHPELCPIVSEGRIWMFCRDDQRRVPLLYLSEDRGESWSGPVAHDVPFVNSKIYAGVLSDGRAYLIGNIDLFDRTRLALYLAAPGTMRFDKRLLLSDEAGWAAHYPSACEAEGKLFVIYTAGPVGGARGARIAAVDLSKT
ncbi:MAG: exo-alpha-sialidase [Clostridia bacterium]|nr:exo-alpha-sialidase [Clostridia bacterium]